MRVGRLFFVLTEVWYLNHHALGYVQPRRGNYEGAEEGVGWRVRKGQGVNCSFTLCSETVYVANPDPECGDAITVTD